MRQLFILIALTICFSPLFGQAKQDDYFEGYVDYKAEYKSMIPGVSDNEFRERAGQFVRIYFKEGNLKWVFTDNDGYIKSTTISLEKTKTYYSWSEDSPDTIYSFDLGSTKRMPVDSVKEVGRDTVLGKNCIIVELKGTANYENPAFSLPVINYYYFYPELTVNPDHYKYYKEIRWDEITAKYRSVAIKMMTVFENFLETTLTATKIVKEKVDMEIFQLDKTKFIKPTFVK